jgi:hypothetical protein
MKMSGKEINKRKVKAVYHTGQTTSKKNTG